MRKHWLIAIALWAGLMLLGWAVLASRIENTLETAAREALLSHSSARFLKNVTVAFDGQEAVLGGKVHRAAMRGLAAKIVGEELNRGSGSGISAALNPVTLVRNEIAIELLPPGWLVLVINGDRASLAGLAGSDDERDQIAQVAEKLLAKPGMDFSPKIEADDERAGTSADLDQTLGSLAARLRVIENGTGILIARIGEEWQSFEPSAENPMHEQLASFGASEAEWERDVYPLVKMAQQRQIEQQRAAAEAAKLAKLPLPHLVLAIKGSDVMLQGEVGSAQLKTQIVEGAIEAYRGRRVFDLIRVTAARRPSVDATSILKSFPILAEGERDRLVAAVVPGQRWTAASLTAADLVAAITAAASSDIDAKLVEPDAKNIARWLGDVSPDPTAQIKPHLTLAVFGDRVWLRGQVAEESSRTQILDAARKMYPGHVLVPFIRLNTRCTPVDEALPTARSFPPAPEAAAPGIVAFAIPGEAWNAVTVSDAVLTPDGIERSGILPEGFPATIANEEFAEALDALKAFRDKMKNPKTK